MSLNKRQFWLGFRVIALAVGVMVVVVLTLLQVDRKADSRDAFRQEVRDSLQAIRDELRIEVEDLAPLPNAADTGVLTTDEARRLAATFDRLLEGDE